MDNNYNSRNNNVVNIHKINKTHKQKTMKLLALLGLSLATPSSVHGFTAAASPASHQARTTHTPTEQRRSRRSVSSSFKTPVPVAAPLLMMPLKDLDLKLSLPTELLTLANSNGASPSSLVQAEAVNALNHALLDFASLFGGATLLVRLAAVIGRICVVGVDVGHASADSSSILPDELAFQFGLLAFALYQVISTALPKIQASMAPPLMTSKDRQAFRGLFRPAGISWHQYKQLAVNSMDWITVAPGETLMVSTTTASGDCNNELHQDAVYWLQQGDVQVFNALDGNDTFLQIISSRDTKEVAGLGLLGESKLARVLDGGRSSSKSNSKRSYRNTKSQQEQQAADATTIKAVAGPSGATLLRMNTNKLERLLRHDPELSSLVSRLAFKGMQDKLDTFWKTSTSYPSNPAAAAAVVTILSNSNAVSGNVTV